MFGSYSISPWSFFIFTFDNIYISTSIQGYRYLAIRSPHEGVV